MPKKINANRILDELNESKSDRTKTSLYLSKKTYNAFKKALEKKGQTPSVVIEKLMVDFLDALNGK